MKFIEDLKKELDKSNLTEDEIQEVIQDFSEMVEEALASGLNENELENKFGNPLKIAEELSTEYIKEDDTNTSKLLKFKPENGYNIVIELLNEDLDITMANVDEIIVEPKNIRRLKEFEINYENNTFTVRRLKKQTSGIFVFMHRGSFVITLPKLISIKEMAFSNINGDGEIKELSVENIKFKITNGDYKFTKNNYNNFEIESVNGETSLIDVDTKRLKISLINGDISLKNITIEDDFNINSVSGDIEVDNLICNQAFVRSVSGDFEADEFYPKELTIKTVSGDVDINNKNKEKQIQSIKKSTVNGDIQINQ